EHGVSRSRSPALPDRLLGVAVAGGRLGVGFAGAGSYAARRRPPHVQQHEHARLQGVVPATGLNAQQKAEKFGFEYCTTEIEAIPQDEGVDVVFIATRHSTHADFTIRALESGKHVFVEKPMVVSEEQLKGVRATYEKATSRRPTALMVGLNRRFAPMVSGMM